MVLDSKLCLLLQTNVAAHLICSVGGRTLRKEVLDCILTKPGDFDVKIQNLRNIICLAASKRHGYNN